MTGDNLFFDLDKLKHLGKNSIIGKTVRIRHPERVTIGDNVIIDDFTYISGEVSIGDYVHIGPGCVLSASGSSITMEALSGLSAACKVYGGSSSYMSVGLDMPTIPKEHQYNVILDPVMIRSFALIGVNGVILPGTEVPQGFATAANLILRKKLHLNPWHIMLDNDGRQIKRRGVREVAERVRKFYDIEINDE